MRKETTNNAFITEYDGDVFPCRTSNEITYECFCFMGGLENNRLARMEHRNGTMSYVTYHRIDRE